MTPDAEDADEASIAPPGRKEREAFAVSRLTTWIGAAALSLSGIFTAFAARGVPMTFGVTPAANVQPSAAIQNQVSGALDDRIVVRRVYVPPVRPSTGGVRAAQPTADARSVTTVVSGGAAREPPPKPVAATGGSAPRH